MYLDIDPVIRSWATKHSLVLNESSAGKDARFVYTSSESECFQIFIEIAAPHEFVVHACSVDTINDEDLHQIWRATELNVGKVLEQALGQVRIWMARSTEAEPAMRSAASLRIYGDNLNPEEVTRLLGCNPTSAHSKGQIRSVGKTTGRVNLARTGHWHLNAPDRCPDDLSAQILEIFAQLSPDPQVWHDLTTRFKVDVFCGLFMWKNGEGFTLSTQAMAALSVRNVKVDICLYGPI